MFPSTIKILEGEFHEGELKLTLTVEFEDGQPKEGDVIFSPEAFLGDYSYIILEINKTVYGNRYEIVLDYHEPKWVWEKRWEKYIKRGHDNALCGINVNEYQKLTTTRKIAYFSKLADFIGVGSIPEFLKSNIQPAIKLVLKDREGEIGLTKFGGLPIAPKGFVFPKDNDKKSSLFIGQIYFGELKRFKTLRQFKGEGILSFFATINKEKGRSFEKILCRYSREIKYLKIVDLPQDLEEYGVFAEKDVMAIEEIELPSADSTSLWVDEEMTLAESDSLLSVENLLRFYNPTDCLNLLCHPSLIPETHLRNAEFMHERRYDNWYDPEDKAEDIEMKWEELIKKVTPYARQWRHLLSFEISDYFQKLSNFTGEFNKYMPSWNIMIKQSDFDKMYFDDIVTVYGTY